MSHVDGRRQTVPQQAVLGLLRLYKVILSPLFTGSCRFVPSCSDYAAEAVARFGVVRGGWLALRRLSRCRPFGSHGWDPVPRPGGRPGETADDGVRV